MRGEPGSGSSGATAAAASGPVAIQPARNNTNTLANLERALLPLALKHALRLSVMNSSDGAFRTGRYCRTLETLDKACLWKPAVKTCRAPPAETGEARMVLARYAKL